jgi:DNA-binding NtrC family response regulator
MELKALVVDDDSLIRIFYRRALKSFGYEVTIASGASEALNILDTKSFDLLVTDIKMPEISGVDLLDEIKKLAISIPRIVICSGCHREKLPSEIIEGASFLQKPFSLSELKDVLDIAQPQGFLDKTESVNGFSAKEGVTNV